MNIREEIESAERLSGKLGYEYTKKAVYGSASKSDLVTFMRLNCYIRALKRNIPQERKIKISEPRTVKFSSLKIKNNTVILDEHTSHYECVELRPCLSDENICRIFELIRGICVSSS